MWTSELSLPGYRSRGTWATHGGGRWYLEASDFCDVNLYLPGACRDGCKRSGHSPSHRDHPGEPRKRSQGRWEVEGCRAADVRQMQRLLKSCLLRLASLDGPWSIDLLRDHLMMLCEHHVNFRAKKKLLKTMDEKDFISQGKEPVLKPH